jgi:hypothetical protein
MVQSRNTINVLGIVLDSKLQWQADITSAIECAYRLLILENSNFSKLPKKLSKVNNYYKD